MGCRREHQTPHSTRGCGRPGDGHAGVGSLRPRPATRPRPVSSARTSARAGTARVRSSIRSTQTPDGFLWLVTGAVNLGALRRQNVHQFRNIGSHLVVALGGDLWVGTRQALIRIPAANFHQLTLTGSTPTTRRPGSRDDLICCAPARGGALWVGTHGGLFRYDGKQFVADRSARGDPRDVTKPRMAIPGSSPARSFMEVAGSEPVPHPGFADRLGVKRA